jgi:hypothetical protein
VKTFDEVWKFTDTVPGSFTRLSAEKLYELGLCVPWGGNVAEIGVDQGRSLSVMLFATLGLSPMFYLVDSWESVLIDNQAKVEDMIKRFEPTPNYAVLQMRSAAAAKLVMATLDLIHIDAHHFDDIEDGGPSKDCELWLPKVKSGGVACFHDYHSCFPDVTTAVDKCCAGWEDLGDWDGLAIRRKP